uniref:Uncharacterized protein n=1 Tax=Ditylenchus dipsaci TaxID=166011 RepID=A0A915DLQ6_9BILA
MRKGKLWKSKDKESGPSIMALALILAKNNSTFLPCCLDSRTVDAVIDDGYRVVFDKEEMIPAKVIKDYEVMFDQTCRTTEPQLLPGNE